MKILVACEESQAVTKELRRLGHEAYSCDIIPCSGGHPEWHINQDVLPLLNPSWVHRYSDEPAALGFEFFTEDRRLHFVGGKWDMIIAFPPCTHLAVSGARHFEKKRTDGRQREAIEFFCQFLVADCPRVVIENPMGIVSGGEYIKKYFPDLAEKYGLPRQYTQTIQPWWFAQGENDAENYHEKTTCLWVTGLKPLVRPVINFNAPARFVTTTGKSFPAWYSKSSLRGRGNRQVVRSKTFPGVARAMAEQWAGMTTGGSTCKSTI